MAEEWVSEAEMRSIVDGRARRYRWNPTVTSYVLSRLQREGGHGQISEFSSVLVDRAAGTYQVTLRATDAGAARVAGWVSACQAEVTAMVGSPMPRLDVAR